MKDNYKNIAYSKEYLQYRQSLDWLFKLEAKEIEIKQAGYGYLIEEHHYYIQKDNPDTGYLTNYAAVKALVKDSSGKTLQEIKSIDSHFFAHLFRHANGKDYLVYNIDLYGYSVMELPTGQSADYVPFLSFEGGGETFIWCDKFYSPVNNLLVVDGCYWACPWHLEFYDFSNPLSLPLPKYCDSYQFEDALGMSSDDDISFSSFTQTGECILEGLDKDNQAVKKVVDIVKLKI